MADPLPADRYVSFPSLQGTAHAKTSEPTPRYNCIAWAADDKFNFWWPKPRALGYHWPKGAPRVRTLDAFQKAFELRSYQLCADGAHEIGFEKIAIYADSDGLPTHAARQLPNGRWTSKLGSLDDIEHELRALDGALYGQPVLFMRRPRPA
ncbi:MAG: hypothetical protein KIT58_03965 [Planctomycetota bacterium]|nr:hypothetical protein [Planctomycetota bacterium]